MFKLLVVIIFIWLLVKSIGFMLKITWGIAKFIAAILMILALPALIAALIFASGVALLAPIAMIAVAAGILKLCL